MVKNRWYSSLRQAKRKQARFRKPAPQVQQGTDASKRPRLEGRPSAAKGQKLHAATTVDTTPQPVQCRPTAGSSWCQHSTAEAGLGPNTRNRDISNCAPMPLLAQPLAALATLPQNRQVRGSPKPAELPALANATPTGSVFAGNGGANTTQLLSSSMTAMQKQQQQQAPQPPRPPGSSLAPQHEQGNPTTSALLLQKYSEVIATMDDDTLLWILGIATVVTKA